MQKILSSFVLREYRQYTPQQIEIFKRSSSVNKSKSKQSADQKTAASISFNQPIQSAHHVQTTQFRIQNEVEELGQAVEKVEEAVKKIMDNQRKYKQQYRQKPFDIKNDQQSSGGLLKAYKQKMKKTKEEKRQFDLRTFKTRLNYKMYNKDDAAH